MAMTGPQLREFRRALGLTQVELGELLEISTRQVIYFETGTRAHDCGATRLPVPRTVELACAALARGITAFDGTMSERQRRRWRSAVAAAAGQPAMSAA